MATNDEMEVLKECFLGKAPSVDLLEAIGPGEFTSLIFEVTLGRKGFDKEIVSYLASDVLKDEFIAKAREHFESYFKSEYDIKRTVRELDPSVRLVYLETFPQTLPFISYYIDSTDGISYIREKLETREGFEEIEPYLKGLLWRWGDDGIVETAFGWSQNLSWLPINDDGEKFYSRLLKTDEQVRATLSGVDFEKHSSHVEMIFGHARIIPSWLINEAFSTASLDTYMSYMDALKENTCSEANEALAQLDMISSEAKPIPGRPSIELVNELKKLRAIDRSRNGQLSREGSERLEILEHETLSYEATYNLKVKALSRAKAQEASGELSDPFKVVELEDLISKIEDYMAYRAVKNYLREAAI